MYECVECSAPAAAIYIESRGTFRQLSCSSCGKLIDPFVEVDGVTLFLHMMLVHLPVYRHLAFNRHARRDGLGSTSPQIIVRSFSLILAAETFLHTKHAHLFEARDTYLGWTFVPGHQEYINFFVLFAWMALLSLAHLTFVAVLLASFTPQRMSQQQQQLNPGTKHHRPVSSPEMSFKATFLKAAFIIKVASFPYFLFALVAIFIEPSLPSLALMLCTVAFFHTVALRVAFHLSLSISLALVLAAFVFEGILAIFIL